MNPPKLAAMARPKYELRLFRDRAILALEREQQTREQARENRTRLLALLEMEQQARRDLEQKLLLAPRKKGKDK